MGLQRVKSKLCRRAAAVQTYSREIPVKELSRTGIVLAIINLVLVVYFVVIGAGDGLGMIFVIDFPAYLVLMGLNKLFPEPGSMTGVFLVYILALVILGGLQWYGVGWFIDRLGAKLFPKLQPKVSVAFVLICLFALAFFLTDFGRALVWLLFDSLEGDPPVPAMSEIVIPPDAEIVATTAAGTIKIRSGKGLRRYYTWDGETRSVVMRANKMRWYGSLGIDSPAEPIRWMPVNGISGAVLSESQKKFDTIVEAENWLHQSCTGCVYTDYGLVVQLEKRTPYLFVEVLQILVGGKILSPFQETAFQGESVAEIAEMRLKWGNELDRKFYMDGKKPEKLNGSNNSAIVTSWDNSK
jgi:hypothetical protein